MLYRMATAACLVVMLTGCAKIVTQKVSEIKLPAPMDGIFYALPRTVVSVEIPIEKTKGVPGQYADFLELLFPPVFESHAYVPSSNLVTAGTCIVNNEFVCAADPSGAFALKKPVFSSSGEPDPLEIYYFKIPERLPVNRSALFTLTESGVLQSAKAQAEDTTLDIALTAVSTITGLAAKAGAFAISTSAPPPPEKTPSSLREALGPEMNFDQSDTLANDYDQLNPEAKKRLEDVYRKIGQAGLMKVLNRFRHIRDLAKRRAGLVQQEGIDVALPALDTMLKELDSEIARQMETFFTGKTNTKVTKLTFDVRAAAARPFELMKFDASKGVCSVAKEHYRGTPLPDKPCEKPAPVTLTISIDGVPEEQLYEQVKDFKQEGERGFRYRIPARCLVKLVLADSELGRDKIAVGQLGRIASLPASAGGRSVNYNLQLYDASGAMKSFELASTSVLNKGVIESLGGSAQTALAARLAAEEEARKKADPLAVLQSRQAYAESAAKLQKACAELKVECNIALPPEVVLNGKEK